MSRRTLLVTGGTCGALVGVSLALGVCGLFRVSRLARRAAGDSGVLWQRGFTVAVDLGFVVTGLSLVVRGRRPTNGQGWRRVRCRSG